MKLITRDTDYAIRALSVIALRRDGVVSCVDLVGELKIPRPFLRKLLQVLSREKILKSHKGQGGGFTLCKSPAAITVYDLMKIYQGPVQLIEHTFKSKACPNVKKCLLKKKLDTIEAYVIQQLKAITLASILTKEG